jgi:hypothetical protein
MAKIMLEMLYLSEMEHLKVSMRKKNERVRMILKYKMLV